MEVMQEEKRKRERRKPWAKNKKIRQGAIISTPGYHHLIYLYFLLFDYLSIVNWI
jgi:hypothetical protein